MTSLLEVAEDTESASQSASNSGYASGEGAAASPLPHTRGQACTCECQAGKAWHAATIFQVDIHSFAQTFVHFARLMDRIPV